MTSQEWDSYLSNTYYNPRTPGSFGGIIKLWQSIRKRNDKPHGLTLKYVKKWLNKQETYRMHKKLRKRFRTEKLIFDNLDTVWSTDLISVQNIKKWNNNFTFLMVVVDCFSRFMFVCAIKKKTGEATAAAFQDIITTTGRVPNEIRSDAGGEYVNSKFDNMLKKYDIRHIICYGDTKCSIVERANQTLLHHLYKAFHFRNSYNFTEILDDVVWSLNHTVHSFIKKPPADVTNENAEALYENIYLPIINDRAQKEPVYSYQVGDLVRISRGVITFGKGFKPKFTSEIFRIINRIQSDPVRYKISDLRNSSISGSYYTEELLKTPYKHISDIPFKIERVLGHKKIDGKTFRLVKWKNYSSKFNQYLSPDEYFKYRA
jgi:hypothetical protein